MKYLLDTNACISYLNHPDSPIRQRLETISPYDVAICSVVEGELYYGVMNSAKPEENEIKLSYFLQAMHSFHFDRAAAREYGAIRVKLSRNGMLIGPYDMQIGAIALSNKLTVVTHNTKEFSRIEGLLVEDWEVGRE